MPKSMFQADRYHMTMGNFSLSKHAYLGNRVKLADTEATFYAAFRKLPFAPCVGHERLVENLTHINIDSPRIRFLKNDRAGLGEVANLLENTKLSGVVRTVKPGTIIFTGEPFSDITGSFGLIQLSEVKFEHAFDIPMTVASRALEMRLVAEDRWLTDFSLRRNGEVERAVDVARYAYIGGFNDTSNMEAGFQLDQFPVGTMAHYLIQSFIGVKEIDPVTLRQKHFEQICFERWLDAHPNGTTLLLDTIFIHSGLVHTIAAAKSSLSRRRAFKACRIDTKPLAEWSVYAQNMLDANGFSEVKIITSGDHDKESIADVVRLHPRSFGFGVGTKLLAEVDNVAGVIFKLCQIGENPTLKCSSRSKATLPGKLQIWRYSDKDGFYLGDLITQDEFDGGIFTGSSYPWANAVKAEPLLHSFWEDGKYDLIPSMQKQRDYVMKEIKRFPDPYNYPVYIESVLKLNRGEVSSYMISDENIYPDIVIPENLDKPEEKQHE